MKLVVILPLVAILFSPSIYAKCDAGSKTLFSCLSKKGKQIELCDAGKTLTYSFGKPQDKPEIVVSVPRNQASTIQDIAGGTYNSYSVDIPNADTVYNVFFNVDSMDINTTGKRTIEAGVHVITMKNLVATVNCSGKNITNNLKGVNLKEAEE